METSIAEREELQTCEVDCIPTDDGPEPCGEVAAARWRWGGEWLYVCEKHDDEIAEKEEYPSG